MSQEQEITIQIWVPEEVTLAKAQKRYAKRNGYTHWTQDEDQKGPYTVFSAGTLVPNFSEGIIVYDDSLIRCEREERCVLRATMYGDDVDVVRGHGNVSNPALAALTGALGALMAPREVESALATVTLTTPSSCHGIMLFELPDGRIDWRAFGQMLPAGSVPVEAIWFRQGLGMIVREFHDLGDRPDVAEVRVSALAEMANFGEG